MTDLVRIDDEPFSAEDFVRQLKLTGHYDGLMEDIIKDKLTVRAAKKHGIRVTPEEIQERADQLRRVRGLHRAADMNRYLDAMGVSLEEFENFIVEMLYHEKMMEEVCSDAAIQEYFSLHSPKFESIELSHIMVDSEGKAKELMSLLEEEPDMFPELAREHSISDTASAGGYVGKILRGTLPAEHEAKVFNAAEGELVGPFASAGDSFEIFAVNTRISAHLDEETRSEVRRLLRDEWLKARLQEHSIEVL